MAAIWTRINSLFLVVLMLMGVTIIAMLAARAEGGPLDPVGTPGPSLPQVEPRMPIPPVGWNGTFPIVINQSGSYFLTRNIFGQAGFDGIVIESSSVSLDLNGFSIVGAPGGTPSFGIEVPASAIRNVEIRNGAMSDWSDTAIWAQNTTGLRVSDMRIAASQKGIEAGFGAVVEDCIVRNNSTIGIVVVSGVVRRCTVFDNQYRGIFAGAGSLIEDNLVFNNGASLADSLRANILVDSTLTYVRDNVVLTPVGGAPTFRIIGTNNHFLRNYYRCGTVVDGGGNFFPAAVDLVDTNYC